MRAALHGDEPWRPEPIPDLTEPLARLRVVGSLWNGARADRGRHAASLVAPHADAAARRAAAGDRSRACSSPLIERAHYRAADSRTRIERAILEDGTVKDDASPALRRIRRELRACAGRADSNSRARDGAARAAPSRRRHVRHDAQRPLRDSGSPRGPSDRRRHRARHVGDRRARCSSSRRRRWSSAIGFASSRPRSSRRSSASCVELTDELRPRRDEIIATLDALVELDSLYARARFAIAYRVRAGDARSGARGLRDQQRPAPAAARAGRRRRAVRSRDGRRTSARCSSPARTPAARRCCSRRSD